VNRKRGALHDLMTESGNIVCAIDERYIMQRAECLAASRGSPGRAK
jgi:hypothetical protein